ncbi:MAG: hypothetical protein NT128_03695 [Proteobacteria bacterium]|nr:hypothetical protein [Pseudomonadota bacterium]
MSDFTFLTRFFVLIIVSSCVVFPSDRENGEGGVVVPVPRKVGPSLTTQLPQDDVQMGVIMSPRGGDGREEPFFMIFTIEKPSPLPLPLSRTLSGCLRSFEENPEVWSQVFGFFNRVAGQKRVLKNSIDDDMASLDRYARNELTDNGFIWGPIGYQSKDGAETRINNYKWLPFVFDMVGLMRDRPDDALQHLRAGTVLAVFQSKLGIVAGKCKADLEKIEKALATLAEAEKYVPRSPQYNPGYQLYDFG